MRATRALTVTVTVGIVAVAVAVAGPWSMVSAFAADPRPAPTVTQGSSVSVTIGGSSSPSPTSSTAPGGAAGSGTSTSGAGGGEATGSSADPAANGGDGTFAVNPDGSPVPSATPAADADALELDHETISVGEWLIAHGTGYTPGEPVQLVLYSSPIVVESFTADAAGQFTARFKIPDALRLGDHTAEATGWTSHRVTNKAFTVVSPAGAGGAGIDQIWWLVIIGSILLLAAIIIAVIFRRSFSRFGSPVGAQGTTA